MDIAHLLNPDHRPAMDIPRLLTRDDSDQSDQVADSPATPSQEAVAPPPAPQTSPKPASPPQTPATPAIPEKPATTAPVKPVTLPQTSATPIPLPEKPVSTAPSPQLCVPPASLPESSLTAVLPSQRAVARARPKRPRKPTIASLRVQKEVCELVVKHLPYVLRDLDDASSSTSTINSTDSEEDDATDPDAQRIRWFLKRMLVLSGQMEVERAKQIEYLRLLKRHYEGTANLHKLMGGLALDYWFWMCDRWRLLARDFYEPLSESKCYAIMHETLQAIKSYKLPEGTKQSDAFGWHDWVRLDADELYVRFMTRKTLMNADLEQLVEHSWSIYSDGDLFKTAHLGDNCEFFLQVLQRISSDMIIIQRVEKYPGLEQLTHSLVILFRVQTDTGFMIIFRCIESPRLQGSDNPSYARRWRNELVIALVRYEIQYLDTPILSAESPLESDNDVTADRQAPPS